MEDPELELPPGNQQAAPRALMEVATSASASASTSYTVTSASPLAELAISPASSPPSRSQGRRRLSPSQERNRKGSSPLLASSSPPRSMELESTDHETDIGQGSLNRGLVVPSSDKEDETEAEKEGAEEGLTDEGEQVTGEGDAQPYFQASRTFNTNSTQAILARRLPAFCRRARPDRPADNVVPSTQGEESGADASQQSRSPRSVRAPSYLHQQKDDRIGAGQAQRQEEDEEEYDEEAHMRDSAAAADESLIVQHRPPRQR
ncbi:hypothetical protein CF326_g2418, partial [Tilletia indica]